MSAPSRLPKLNLDSVLSRLPLGLTPGKLYPPTGKFHAILWARRYAALQGDNVAEPRFDSGTVQPTQLQQGTANIRLPSQADLAIGQIGTAAPPPGETNWTEDWATNNLGNLDNPTGPVDLVFVSSDTIASTMTFTPVTPTFEAEQVFTYLAFPPVSAINALPSGRPSQVFNAQTFTVATLKAGALTVTGRLYREWRVSAPGDGPTRRDFWVLFGAYEMPSPVATTRLSLVPSGDPNNHPDLKSFLLFCNGQPGDKSTWKYVDSPYVWQPV